ncbi:MAG: hypothetical protein HYU69_08140 [Bacteroidetes bacterium]|nr:hypothetical protein [Bacteroidota bacterium]
MYLTFLVSKQGNQFFERILFENPFHPTSDIKLNTEFPYGRFSLNDSDGNVFISKCAFFLDNHSSQLVHKEIADYEILYIGQAMQGSDNLPVKKRLDKHQTFPKILSDYNQNHPDKEIFLLISAVKESALMDVRKPSSTESKHFYNNVKRELLTKDKIKRKSTLTLYEAGLINYFKPSYNTIYVDSMPAKSSPLFNGLKKINLSKFTIEFEPTLPFKLYTSSTGRIQGHTREYNFRDLS